MRKLHWKFIIVLIIIWLVIPPAATAQTRGDPVVRAILFYSPTCPHCHKVITEVLVPMVEDYGSDQLQIIGIDTSQPAGGQLYQATIERCEIPPHREGVPTLVVGEVVLVGSVEIPEVFPELVEEGLNSGGIDWPDIPGLEEVIPFEAEIETQEPPPDPVGFTLAGVVLLGMVVAIASVAWRLITAWPRLFQLDRSPPATAQTWAIPILALLGLGVAAYLAYVEITHVEAVCGPVGECNIVQSSPYARILGIPIAVCGMLNYLAVVVLWAGQKALGSRWANLSALGLLGLAIFGTLFSIYLTCLELFVIHAVCAWCLSSAAVTTLLMLLAAIPITSKES